MTETAATPKVLVVFSTRSGCTQGVGLAIARSLEKRGAFVQVHPAFDAPDPAEFDAVVVGSGVRGAQWHEAARDWVTRHAHTLADKPVALFTVGLEIMSGFGKESEVRGYTDALVERTGIRPVGIGLFAGWFEPRRFSVVERSILHSLNAPLGDHRNWRAIEAWTDTVAPRLIVGSE
jgi:menaquinone-dependent protoporphyrinogen oxidase